MTIPKRLRIFVLGAAAALAAAGPLRAQLRPEAGFVNLDENTFSFHLGSYFSRIALRSSPARIWYVFQPADENPASKPLFVFFNGGPGGATSCGLLSAFTGRLAVSRDEKTGAASIVPNPASWTRLGNLLHLDARTTGFSYSLMENPGDDFRRRGEFDAQNYNPYTDGADFVRVVLRFLGDHPEIRTNRVVLVPESYGGIRTIVMLHLLLYPEKYADGSSPFQNPELVAEIRNHYDAVFPEFRGRTVPPATAARQFGRQILIQTALAWTYQRAVSVEMLEAPGSPLFRIAAETGVPYVPFRSLPGANQNPTAGQIMNYIYAYLDAAGRDPYICSKPSGFFNGHRAAAVDFLTRIASLNLMTGTNAAAIPEMFAAARGKAYKMKAADNSGADLDLSALVGPPPDAALVAAGSTAAGENELAAVFGRLSPWDRFFIDTNYNVTDTFSWNRATLQNHDLTYQSSLLFGQMFLENAAWVETFATNAAFDIVVFTPALPEALAGYTTILTEARLDGSRPAGAARPGEIRLVYRAGAVPGAPSSARTIRFPRYPSSGHAVTLTEPAEMLDDVAVWLASASAPPRDTPREPRRDR